jgi:hypothetical protein
LGGQLKRRQQIVCVSARIATSVNHTLRAISLIILCVAETRAAASPDFVPKRHDRADLSTNRQIVIHPVTPKTGIKTGLVIFMGHPIQPPYQLDWDNARLLINGVKVIPSRGAEKFNQDVATKIKNWTPEERKRKEDIFNAVLNLQEKARRGYPMFLIYLVASRDKMFRDVDWPSGREIEVQDIDGNSFGIALPLRGEKKIEFSEAEKQERNERGRKEQLARWEKELIADRVMTIDANGVLGFLSARRNAISRIPEIMDNSALSDSDKFDAMMQFDRELAWEVIVNYDPKEWTFLREHRVPR